MKKYIIKTLLIIGIFISFQGSCTKPEADTITEKTKILKHNFLVINSVDNTPAQVEVSYSVFIVGNTENIVKTETLITPFIIGGEEVKVAYDSLSYRWQGEYNSSTNVFKRNYTPKGADYLLIKNLSNVDLEYCVVGNNPIQYYDSWDILKRDYIVNRNSFDTSKVIKYAPMPIYNEIPMVYIIKPYLAPKTDNYFLRNTGTYAQKVNLTPPYFGGKITSILSLSDVLNLYKEEYTNGNILYKDYSDYAHSANSLKGIKTDKSVIHLYGKIPAEETFSNTGKIWFINTREGFYEYNYFDNTKEE